MCLHAVVNILPGMWEIVKLYSIIPSRNLCTLMGTCSSSLVLNSGTRGLWLVQM